MIAGELPIAEDLRGLAASAGYAAVEGHSGPTATSPGLAIDCGAARARGEAAQVLGDRQLPGDHDESPVAAARLR